MKIILFGGSGLLGSEIKKVLASKKINFLAPKSSEINILDFQKTQKYLISENPDLIIYAAGYTAVDLAEDNISDCENLNFLAVKNISDLQIPIINFSTEYIFSAPLFCHSELSSESNNFFEIPENFERKALNIYGNSKIKVEKYLEENFKKKNFKFWNIRTTWLFGHGGKNFISTILNAAENILKNKSSKEKILKIVDDQFGRPTFAKDLAEFTVKNFIEKTQDSGHFHVQNSGEIISWANFAKYFLKLKNKKIKVQNIKTSELNFKADRPENSILKNTKNIPNMRDWKDAVQEFLEK